MGRLDNNVEWDGLRDVLDSSYSTSGGSGSVSMSDTEQRQHTVRANGSDVASGTTVSSSATRQANDFRKMFRVRSATVAQSYGVPVIKGSITTYHYGWSTAGGAQSISGGNLSSNQGFCWDGNTNHISTSVSLSGYGFGSNIYASGFVLTDSGVAPAAFHFNVEGSNRANAGSYFSNIHTVRDANLNRGKDVRGAANNTGQGASDSYSRRDWVWGASPVSNQEFSFCIQSNDTAWIKIT